MNRIARTFVFVITSLVLAGCGVVAINRPSGEISPEQSKFKENFSIGAIIEGHQELLIEGPRTLSGMEAGPREPFVQRQEHMAIQIDYDNITALMNSIQSDVEEFLSNSGATIVGTSGSDGYAEPIAYFSYNYREGPFYGVVNVWGVHGEETDFVIIAQITESLD